VIPFLILSKIFNKPIIIFCGDYELNNHPEFNYGNQRSFIRGLITRIILRYSNIVVIPSPPFVDIIKRVEPNTKHIEVIPWCVEIQSEEIDKKDMVSTAIFTKSTWDRKGIPTFSAATKNMNAKILVRVPREEYIETLKSSKVYCQLTKPECESFGVSLLEAMSYGCVPIITNCQAMEWVAGGTGIVVPFGDVYSTKEAIKKAMTMDGSKARERAKFFTMDKRKEAFVKLIRDVTNNQNDK
jgi:hypothetical protein